MLGPGISGTKCDRDKPIFSAQRMGQIDRNDAYNRDPIRLQISKMRVINTEPPYHAKYGSTLPGIVTQYVLHFYIIVYR